MTGMEKILGGIVAFFISVIVSWLYNRDSSTNIALQSLETKHASEIKALQKDIHRVEEDLNVVKVELPTNYVTKEDLTILKSDILSEIREKHQLTKDMYDTLITYLKDK